MEAHDTGTHSQGDKKPEIYCFAKTNTFSNYGQDYSENTPCTQMMTDKCDTQNEAQFGTSEL